MTATVVFYIFVFGLVLYLLRNPYDKKQVIAAYVILFLLFVLRYDIGNDYVNYFRKSLKYATIFRNTYDFGKVLENVRANREILPPLLSSLFSFSRYPFVWVNLVYSTAFLWCAYKVFKWRKMHFWGWLFIIVSGFLFFSWDRIRQGTAAIVLLYALYFLEEKKYRQYFIAVLGAVLFHNSAALGFLFFPLKFLKLPTWSLFAGLVVSGVLMWMGRLDEQIFQWSLLFEDLEGYEAYAYASQTLTQFTSAGYKFRMTIFLLLGGSVMLALKNREYNLYKNILMIGLFVFVVASGSMIFTRISWNFMIVFSVALPLAFKVCNGWRRKLLYTTVMLLVVLFLRDIVTNINTLGCIPYDSILSPNMYDGYFRPKSWN